MNEIYCTTSSKGGIGKSTTVQNVGYILSTLGKKVLCVDTDEQGHLSIACGVKDLELLPMTIVNLFDMIIKQEPLTKELVQSAIIKTNTFDILPSSFLLNKLEFALNSIHDREYGLSDILSLVSDDYDMILIDTNSSRNIFTINALTCANKVIIPCQSQFLSSGAIELMLSTMQSLKKRINPNLQLDGILVTMYQSNTIQSRTTLDFVKHEYGNLIYPTIIPSSVKVADAQSKGMSVVEYDKNNPVSIAYHDFVIKELIA
jgi:chromosome partitioning protein